MRGDAVISIIKSSKTARGSANCLTRPPSAAITLAEGRRMARNSVALTCVLPLMQRK